MPQFKCKVLSTSLESFNSHDYNRTNHFEIKPHFTTRLNQQTDRQANLDRSTFTTFVTQVITKNFKAQRQRKGKFMVNCNSPWISSQLSRCFSQRWCPAGLRSPPTRSQREGCQIWHKGCKRSSRLPCLELCFHNLSKWGKHKDNKRVNEWGIRAGKSWKRKVETTWWGGSRGGLTQE